ncbi:hypothetical protein NQ023_09125 [Corynebacterium phoceense]|uniref:hypothetical protein n=1 Tax=Corynebacterium phoceense TaxID=1686286 RepID=UPI00211C42B1|nr:hypothetical protein [Corynebacterium phoceense]MCQ9348623.1 hypothetical protein [Corynebacterium phoceense]
MLSLWTQLPISENSLEEHPRARILRAAGCNLGLVEQASEVGIGKLGTPAVPEGLRAEFFTGIMPLGDLIDSFLDIVKIADVDGVVAFTAANVYPDHPHAMEQGPTVAHRRARGRGLATLVKQVLADEVAQRYPDIERVTTYNALDNAPMLAINNKLGLVPKFYETNWLKRI